MYWQLIGYSCWNFWNKNSETLPKTKPKIATVVIEHIYSKNNVFN